MLRFFHRLSLILNTSFLMGNGVFTKFSMASFGVFMLILDSWRFSWVIPFKLQFKGIVFTFYFKEAGDFELFHEIFIDNPFSHIPPLANNAVVIDIGANIGVSVAFFKCLYPDAQIYAYEPDPTNYARLTTLKSTFEDIHPNNIAVWSKNDHITFFSDSARGSSSSIVQRKTSQRKIDVVSKSFDQLLEEIPAESIDLLKIDVEGAEKEIFSQFAAYNKIKTLVGELHHDLCDTKHLLQVIYNNYSSVTLKPMNHNRDYIIATKNAP